MFLYPNDQAAGIKETYFGYEEADSNSVADDSEMSLSIGSSSDMLDDEDVFEEVSTGSSKTFEISLCLLLLK